jgi:hypothetical protein
MKAEYVLTGRDHAGRIVAEEKTDSGKTADKVCRQWRESGLMVEVEERAPEIPPGLPGHLTMRRVLLSYLFYLVPLQLFPITKRLNQWVKSRAAEQ